MLTPTHNPCIYLIIVRPILYVPSMGPSLCDSRWSTRKGSKFSVTKPEMKSTITCYCYLGSNLYLTAEKNLNSATFTKMYVMIDFQML